MKRIAPLTLMMILLGLSLSGPAMPLFACTPPPGTPPHYTVSDHVEAASVVIEGVVLNLDDNYPRTATLQVKQYIKGSGPAVLRVAGYGSYPDCLPRVAVGEHWLFYIHGDQASGYQPFRFIQYDAMDLPDSQNLAAAIAAAGQDPILISPGEVDPALTQLAAAPRTFTPTPTPFPPSRDPSSPESALTQAGATADAAGSAYASDPAGQSVILTQARATAYAAQTNIALTQTASLRAGTAVPTAFQPSPSWNQMSTDAWATLGAASILYPNDPAAQAAIRTPVYATVQALYTAYALTVTPSPTVYIVPRYSPTPASTTGEIVGLIGIGSVIGLILGLFAGMLVGIFLGRWRE